MAYFEPSKLNLTEPNAMKAFECNCSGNRRCISLIATLYSLVCLDYGFVIFNYTQSIFPCIYSKYCMNVFVEYLKLLDS